MKQITAITPTICRLMGIDPPKLSIEEALEIVLDAKSNIIGEHPVEKCFIYAPDAIGEKLFQMQSKEFEAITKVAPVQVVLRSIMPPKTPVCFASMFTGAKPDAHGIKRYEKPVLSCDTLFDALIRAEKKMAIVAVRESSISLIFLNRHLDYFIEDYDQQVIDRTHQILRDYDHDLILVYNQEYDDTMHRTTPCSEEALNAMKKHLETFVNLTEAFLDRYKDHNCLTLFSPDHGAHINPETGHGDHGLDTPEDMEVRSFWGIHDKTNQRP